MNINKCSNCGAAMSCTCQQRRSVGGRMGCSACIGSMNAGDRKNGLAPQVDQKKPLAAPTVYKATHNYKKT